MRPLIFCLGLIGISSLQSGSVTQEATSYERFCEIAAHHPLIFSQFRREPACIGMMEHVSYEQGWQLLQIIKTRYPHLAPYLSAIAAEDVVGKPIPAYYPSVGWISPTTLRYVKIAGDLQAIFKYLHPLKIIEIGGGYGGQCKILHDIWGFDHYTLIDLKACLPLIEKYLSQFGISAISCISTHGPLSCDLLISNHAFSEIDREEQLLYLNQIIKHAPRGYITYNQISRVYGISSLSVEEVVAGLKKEERIIRVEPETPLTGDGNCVIIWYPAS
jgi:hypothetical protein